MKLTDYLKDRLPACLIGAVTLGLVLLFLADYHVPAQAALIVSVIILLGGLCAELWNYQRSKMPQ